VSLLEDLVGILEDPLLPHHVDEAVVEAYERQMQLRDDDVLVVSRVADDGDALLVAR